MEDSHPVHVLPDDCGFVNLRHLGMGKGDRAALYFYWPQGNRLDAEELMLHEGYLFFWRREEWWRLDVRDLDLSGLQGNITLLPLPDGMSLDAVAGAAPYTRMQTYTVPLR